MCCDNVVSTFPIGALPRPPPCTHQVHYPIAYRACPLCTAVGARITGVDDCTFSSTGEAYSMVALPNTNNCKERKLQADDVSLGAPAAPHVPRPCTLSNPAPVPRSLRIRQEVPGELAFPLPRVRCLSKHS